MALRNAFRFKFFIRTLEKNYSHSAKKPIAFGKTFLRHSSTQLNDIQFRQLFDRESCTYTYLLADTASSEAILIDPVIEWAERDLELVKEMRVNLKYVHYMNDLFQKIVIVHILWLPLFKIRLIYIWYHLMLRLLVMRWPTMIFIVEPHLYTSTRFSILLENMLYSKAQADILVKDGDFIKFGDQALEVRSTPGHTNGCVTYVDHEHGFAFTGDVLLIRGCGRTDFQEGSSQKLYNSVHNRIFTLPSHYLLYPAHDYFGKTVTTVEEEKKYNPRLTKTEDEFIKIMENLNLPYPDKIDISLPANKVCGLYNLPDNLSRLFGNV
ncbi:Persulfide dioxygenase ETHE1, mitochondrial [Armadillidium nasatum]|uniref:Persulfide dioxygenase ETHE1, mitochondrial n=1 Tax=Armadillidium nasatum TaxID=96803 RepID=A0A5N5SYR9_9CRUS|nr:Persulfide dioxygenase ETHE1, mitochondrial [Armadillidium nasatum]